ncbi:uncharacterized protein [Euphorbia lathyris]|uniref:uncharacterized protein n=1 Tax=Euphorbia lathyris TaxID=212925 RepID=UPI00331330D1
MISFTLTPKSMAAIFPYHIWMMMGSMICVFLWEQALKEARHYASLALLHHLKAVHKFTVINVNYKPLFEQNLGCPLPESDGLDLDSLFAFSDDLLSFPPIESGSEKNLPLYGASQARVKELEGQLKDLSSRILQAESELHASQEERDDLKKATTEFSMSLKKITAFDAISEPGSPTSALT